MVFCFLFCAGFIMKVRYMNMRIRMYERVSLIFFKLKLAKNRIRDLVQNLEIL